MKKYTFFVLVALLLLGCNNTTIFKDYKKMDNISWNRFDIVEFEVPVKKGKPMDFYLSLRHHTNMSYKFIDVNVTFFTPDGEMRSRDNHYRLIGTDLKWKGIGMGDLWDIDLPIRKEMLFNKSGVCKIKIENKMSRLETTGIIEVGLIVKKSN